MRGNDTAVAGRIYPRGRDEDNIDLRFSPGGTAFSNFTISSWSHKDKDTDENVYLSYQCVAFGDLAEHIAESCEPGDTVVALGRLQSNNWEDKEGEMHYGTQLIIDELGLSLRWGTAQPDRVEQSTPKAKGKGKAKGKAPSAREDYGPDEAPF